ncbi:hypothetical protein I3843_16G102100 [Carya illinoinensis]|uniref:tRNA pseudouridine synthase n=1 Tax=Carya illinoinensis TaxID=32201 RepID=A0A922A3I6_CARIL|nr:hypothetical protein I3760_16G105100 [Carya illinoinensis]KAG6673235.1 hypothetical protein I3842_16G100900 [Carya illinoinensis]KAG7942428.1 hypothetical protein I3843_16G102100 [Carya illinoinensis]
MIASCRVSLVSPREGIRRFAMENQARNKVYVHYNHTDPCRYERWTARESYEFMHTRPWQEVVDFYSNSVNGRASILSALFGIETHNVHNDAETLEVSDKTELESVSAEDRTGRWARLTFKIVLSYHGGSFDGWQKQPGLNTVQGVIERSLANFVDENKVQLLKDKGLPVEGSVVVAGRTDKGVTALQQVCAFSTWRKDIKSRDIEEAINGAVPRNLIVRSVSEVSRAFHPNFSAKWRHYFYILPLNDWEGGEQGSESGQDAENFRCNENTDEQRIGCDECNVDTVKDLINDYKDEHENGKKPRTFSIIRVNQLLQQLEGKLLSYKMFARDTKASRNVGPPTQCFVYHARAAEVRLPCSDHGEGRKVMCVELVANRFLRKMVRVLVATSVREAAAGADEDALIKLMDATCRRATAPPAPPDGLCLVDVGYAEFDSQYCLIPKD